MPVFLDFLKIDFRVNNGFSENRDTTQFASVNFFAGKRKATVILYDNEAYRKFDSKMFVKEDFRGSHNIIPV